MSCWYLNNTRVGQQGAGHDREAARCAWMRKAGCFNPDMMLMVLMIMLMMLIMFDDDPALSWGGATERERAHRASRGSKRPARKAASGEKAKRKSVGSRSSAAPAA